MHPLVATVPQHHLGSEECGLDGRVGTRRLVRW